MALAAPAGSAHADVALSAARQARALALALGRDTEAGRAGVWACAHLLRLGRYEELLQEAAVGRPLVARAGLEAELRELLRLLSLAGSEAGNFEVALKAAQELVALSAEAGDDAALTAALALAVCYERMGDSWQAMRLLEEALRDHGQAGAEAPESVLLPLLMASNGLCATALGIAHRLLDLDDAAELQAVLGLARLAGERASELLARMPDPVYRVAVMGNLGEVLMYQGDLAAAAPLVQGAYEHARRLGLRAYAWRIQATLGALQVAQGEALAALHSMRELVAEMGTQAPPQTLVRTHHVAYRACSALGRCDDALGHFEAAERIERRRTMAQLRAQSTLFVTRTEAQRAQWQAEQARREAQEQRERAAAAAEHAERDPLTGLGNRRHLQTRCAELLRAARRQQRPLALALLDLDRFKDVNDTHGHAVGDAVLVALAQLLRESMRTDDVLVRHGGEEFVLVLPGLATEAAVEVCERLRERVAAFPWQRDCGTSVPVTASLGLATAPAYELETLLARADEALYRAKSAGRNRVLLAPA
ncbi:hypothetical protein IP87_15560 [beta proteobacterium AAP121]|nr:hypothetical protein IP80_05820 [beta proteobacterium AAP65]KPF95964.1 hypothetical protein IP87_15560 [beta proteobacterium AAP121]